MAIPPVNSFLDINTFSLALTKTISSDLGIIIPMIGLKYIRTFAAGAIGLGGNMGMLAQGAIDSFFTAWEINMVTGVPK